MIIRAQNLLDTTALNTYLNTNSAVGASTFYVQNINSFNANWAVQFGKTNEEKAEILIITSAVPSGTTLVTTGTARFSHNVDTPVFGIKYDRIIFKRSTSGTAGTAVAFTSSTVPITPDSLYTELDDVSSLSTYAYKACFYNSVSGDISSDSDWITTSGFSFYSLATMRQNVKDNLFSAGYLTTKENVIDSWINGWQEKMNNSAIKVNQDYSLGTVNVSFGTAGFGTITATDFKTPRKVEVTYDGTNYVNSRQIPISEFSNADVSNGASPTHYWRGNNVLGIRPAGSGGTALVTYGALPSKLENDTDELSFVLRPYTTSCIDYCLARAYYNDQKIDFARDHMSLFEASKKDFISEITPRDQSGEKYINMVEELSGMEDSYLDSAY